VWDVFTVQTQFSPYIGTSPIHMATNNVYPDSICPNHTNAIEHSDDWTLCKNYSHAEYVSFDNNDYANSHSDNVRSCRSTNDRVSNNDTTCTTGLLVDPPSWVLPDGRWR
jgi:hypothetical protein